MGERSTSHTTHATRRAEARPASLPSETPSNSVNDVVEMDGSHVGTPGGGGQHPTDAAEEQHVKTAREQHAHKFDAFVKVGAVKRAS